MQRRYEALFPTFVGVSRPFGCFTALLSLPKRLRANSDLIRGKRLRSAAVLTVIGVLSLAVVLLPNYGPEWLANGLAPQVASAQTAWAFAETFDGTPTSPQPFSSPRFQLIAGSNSLDAAIDGQTVDGTPQTQIQAGHGPDCGAPIGTTQNNHVLGVNFDLLGFQQTTRPQLAYICNGHMMTVVKSGYGVVSFMPRQAFDWLGRTGTLEFETNLYSFGREWWDVYIVPENEMLLEIVQRDEGGGGEQLPKRGVKFAFGSQKPSIQTIDNYHLVDDWAFWQRYVDAFPNDPALKDPRPRRVFQIQLSQTSWGLNVQKQDGTFWSFNGNFSSPLSFTRGLVRIEHHSYNPTKDGIQGNPWSQYTYHWDNFHFDGPVLPLRPAFGPGPHFVDLLEPPDPTMAKGVTINLPTGFQNPVLVGHLDSMMQNDDVDFQNRSHWRQFRINNGAWQDLPLLKNVALLNGDRGWSTFRLAVTGLVAGPNRIEFRYPTRPPQATWQWDGFRVKDVEIQVDPLGAGSPPSNVTPTAIPAATSTPVPAPTSTPSPTTTQPVPGKQTVTFNDLTAPDRALTGQYPRGLLDWGTGQWYLSGPWGSFATNSVSFNGTGVTSASVGFVTPQLLSSVDAFNGGSATTTVSLSCSGQLTKQVTLAAGQMTTISTGWTQKCSSVGITSTNGWDTNFDNFVVQ